jgi:hypothetical protein
MIIIYRNCFKNWEFGKEGLESNARFTGAEAAQLK